MLLLWIIYDISVLFRDALWSPEGKGLTSWLSFVMSKCEVVFSHWYPGSVWCLIVSIPDLCPLSYFLLRLTKMEQGLLVRIMKTPQKYKTQMYTIHRMMQGKLQVKKID